MRHPDLRTTPPPVAMPGLGVLLRPFRQHLILLLPRQLQMLLAEEPEPRSLRSVLAARVAAAHVAFPTTSATATRSSAVAWRPARQRGSDAIREHLREALNEQVERDARSVGALGGLGCSDRQWRRGLLSRRQADL